MSTINVSSTAHPASLSDTQVFEDPDELRYREFFGRGEFRYAITPDFWKGSWGKPPILGIVAADNEFLAERIAFDKGILNPYNCTFKPKFKNLGLNNTSNLNGLTKSKQVH